ARRLWALFQRYDLWKEFAPAVLDVEIVHAGDAGGNGLLRRVVYPLPFGRRGESFELVRNVKPGVGYDYLMIRSARTARGYASASASTCARRSCAGSRVRSTGSSTRRTRNPCAARRHGSSRIPSFTPSSPIPRRSRLQTRASFRN